MAADNTQYKKLAISVCGNLKVTTKPTFHIATVTINHPPTRTSSSRYRSFDG